MPPRRPLHDGHDVADRELRGRRRQQGPGVPEVHRPAVADRTALRAGDQRPAGTAPRARVDDGRRDGVSRDAVGLPRLHPAFAGGVRRRQAHLRGDPLRAGSAIAPSATSPSGRPALVQDTGWTAHLPSGEGLLAFSTPDEALAGIDRINSRLRRPRAARGEIAREHFDARSCCRDFSTRRAREYARVAIALGGRTAAAHRPRRARSPRRFRRPSPARSRLMTSLLTEGLVARGHDVTLFATGDSTTTGEAARDFRARLLARRAHVAVGAVRDAQPRGRRRARRQLRHHPLRGGVLPDVAGLHASVPDADRPDAASLRRRPPRWRLWRRYPEAPFVAISQRAGAPARGPQRRRHRAARDRHGRIHVPRRLPTTTCCSSAGSPRERGSCRPSRSPDASACG